MCGIAGVYGSFGSSDAPSLTHIMMLDLQDRGQESAGMVFPRGNLLDIEKGMGLVSSVLPDPFSFRSRLAMGQVRYSTHGSSTGLNAQPFLIRETKYGDIAIIHNGNTINTQKILTELKTDGYFKPENIIRDADFDIIDSLVKAKLERKSRGLEAIIRKFNSLGKEEKVKEFKNDYEMQLTSSISDTKLILYLIDSSNEPTLGKAVESALNKVEGAYTIAVMNQDEIVLARDGQGRRPLAYGFSTHPSGASEDIFAFSSESAALSGINIWKFDELEPGHILSYKNGIMKKHQYTDNSNIRNCIVELIYFLRPDSYLFNHLASTFRIELGRRLWKESPVEDAIIVPIMDSGLYAAEGYHKESGLPLEHATIRSRSYGRIFIKPDSSQRGTLARRKQRLMRKFIEGKKVVLVDDTIIRSDTITGLVEQAWACGAEEVHVRVSAPPVKWPCYDGIDMKTRKELVAAWMTTEQIQEKIGATSLKYLSMVEMLAAANQETHTKNHFCTACFDGEYHIGKQLIAERLNLSK